MRYYRALVDYYWRRALLAVNLVPFRDLAAERILHDSTRRECEILRNVVFNAQHALSLASDTNANPEQRDTATEAPVDYCRS